MIPELGGAAPGDRDVHIGHHSADPGGAPRQLRDHQAAAGPRRGAARAARRALRLRRVRPLAPRGLAAALALAHQRLPSARLALPHRSLLQGSHPNSFRVVVGTPATIGLGTRVQNGVPGAPCPVPGVRHRAARSHAHFPRAASSAQPRDGFAASAAL